MFASDGWIESTSGDDTMQKAEKWERVQEMSSGVVGGQPEVWEEQPSRPTCPFVSRCGGQYKRRAQLHAAPQPLQRAESVACFH